MKKDKNIIKNNKIKEDIENKAIYDNRLDKHKNKILLIAIITAILIFMTYVFISQFINFKNTNDVNTKLILTDQKPS